MGQTPLTRRKFNRRRPRDPNRASAQRTPHRLDAPPEPDRRAVPEILSRTSPRFIPFRPKRYASEKSPQCMFRERRGRLRHGFRRARVIRASHRADDVARLDRPTLKRAAGTGLAQSAHTMQQGEPAPPRSRPRSIPVGYAPARWASEDPPWCRRAGALRHRTRRPRLGATEGSYRTRSAHSAARGGATIAVSSSERAGTRRTSDADRGFDTVVDLRLGGGGAMRTVQMAGAGRPVTHHGARSDTRGRSEPIGLATRRRHPWDPGIATASLRRAFPRASR